MQKGNFRAGMLATVAVASLAGSWSAAHAQQAPAAEAPAEEAIIVTGSRIRGIAPVGSNVIAVDAAKIAQEPVNNTNDLLRRVPQVVSLGANRAGGSAQNGAANATRGAGINLRGISTNATLILYDGKRLPAQGLQGQFTDPSSIPAIALERVEVVADGASAIYGSDAIAGVVNFILRRNLNGGEVRARVGITGNGYEEHQVSGIFGRKWDTGAFTIAGEITHNKALLGSELDFYQDDNRYRGGRDLRVTNCDPGTISISGTTYAIPAGGVTTATASSLVAGTSNKCFNNTLDTVIPEQTRRSVLGTFRQEIAPGIRFVADGLYSRRNGVIGGLSNVSATVPSTNPFYVAPAGVTPPLCTGSTVNRCETVNYTFVKTNGGLDYNPYHSSNWNVSAGIEASLFSDWKGAVYYAHGASEEVADRRIGVNTPAMNAALADTNPATALNLFGGPNNPATIAKIRDNLFVITGKTRLDVVNAQVDGSVAQLPGGKARVALGAEYRKEYTFTSLITGQQATQLDTKDAGSRTVKALFGELFIPLFGADNAIPGFQQLSLSVAGRYEKYSDFGETTNPKLGLTWKPVDMLSLKASYGKSFRAPTFTEVSTIAGGAGLYYDTLPGASGNLTGIGIAGGNPGLKPEKATTWSVGGELNPVRGIRATLTYFDINYRDQILSLRGTPNILTNPLYTSFVNLSPTAAQVNALMTSGLPINNTINTAVVQFIVDGRRQNLGKSLVRGIDFGLYFDHEFGAVKVDGGFQGTYYTTFKTQSVPGSAIVNVRNTINTPQKFRSQFDIGAKAGIFNSRVTWNHTSSYLNGAQSVAAYNTIDLLIGAEFSERIRVSFDVRNLFNQDPPFVDTARGYDPQSANPVPRTFSLSAAVKF